MAPQSPFLGDKCDGDASNGNWQRRARNPTFLPRNINKVLRASRQKRQHQTQLRMGNIFSKPKASRPLEDEDDQSPRQAKRLKVHHGRGLNLSDQETSQSTSASLLPGVEHQTQHGSSEQEYDTASRAVFRIDDILPKVPEKAMRIDLLGIKYDPNDDSAKSLAFKAGQYTFRCRCTIAIFLQEYENDTELYELDRIHQNGQIKTIAEDGKHEIELHLREPFIIPAESLYVNRVNGERLANGDKLRIHVWFKSDGVQENWPPFNTASMLDSTELSGVLLQRGAMMHDLWMTARDLEGQILTPGLQGMQLPMLLGYGRLKKEKVKTPFSLQVEVKWSLPGALSSRKRKNKGSMEPGDVVSSQVEIGNCNPAITARASPQRAKRRREEIPNYNVKVLSDIARGDQPKSPAAKQPKRNALVESSVEKVTYMLGRADAADLRLSRETTVPGLGCPFCLQQSDDLESLQWHLKNLHSSFRFSLRKSSPSRLQFFVALAKGATRVEQQRSLQLSGPRTLLDIGRLLDGDRSWEKARRGPEHNNRSLHIVDRFSSSSPSLGGSRYSSPNTSVDDCIDRAARTKTDQRPVNSKNNHAPRINILPKSLSAPKDKLPTILSWENDNQVVFQRPQKVRVPRTGSQLYHPVTRRRLVPGEIIDNSDDENDERWLNQKHRDIIMDYTNISDAEKDYVVRWNPFITMLKLTCDKYMPKVIIRFVLENKLWFLCQEERIREFCKHAEALMLRGSMDGACWTRCMEILRQASAEISPEEVEAFKQRQVPVWDPTQRRGYRDCVCGEAVTPLDGEGVRCHGLGCRDPFFHARCVKDARIGERGDTSNFEALKQWKCAECTGNGGVGSGTGIKYAGTIFPRAKHHA